MAQTVGDEDQARLLNEEGRELARGFVRDRPPQLDSYLWQALASPIYLHYTPPTCGWIPFSIP